MQRTRGFPDPILSFLPSRAGVSQVGLRSLLPEVVEEVLHCLYRAATGRERVHAAKSPPQTTVTDQVWQGRGMSRLTPWSSSDRRGLC